MLEVQKPWGVLTSLDLHECDPDIIRDAEAIKNYAVQLCDLIKVRPFGECVVVHFGDKEEVAGYSMTQLIETSLISGHFANKTNAVYIDIFSCGVYDAQVAADFTKQYFKAKEMKVTILNRI